MIGKHLFDPKTFGVVSLAFLASVRFVINNHGSGSLRSQTVTRLTRCDAFRSMVTLTDPQKRVRPRLARSPALYQSPRYSTLVPALIRSTKFNRNFFSIQVARWIE